MAGALLAALVAVLVVRAAALSPTGINMPRLDIQAPHYGGAWSSASSAIFTNLFKHATPFEVQGRGRGCTSCSWGWGPGEAVVWRPDGYPAEIKSLNSWTDYAASAKVGISAAYYVPGAYVLLYDGAGAVELSGDAAATSSAPGRVQLSLTPASGFYVRVVRTNTSNPLRNIRILPAAAAEDSDVTSPFTDAFLKQVAGFSSLRFTQWQRIWGDERNPQMLRSDQPRATRATQTYLLKDGVALEDMVWLCNKVGADPWFSLPVAANDSDAYATAMASFVAANLAPARSVYIEFGSGGPGWMGTGLATNTLRLARIWRAAFAAAGADGSRVVVVATYESAAWIPYFWNTFGADAAKVDAVAVVGVYGSVRTWNSPRPCYYEFNGATFAQDPANAGIDLARVMALARGSVIHADLVHNRWYGELKARGKRLLAVQGGPDSRMQAAYYSVRMNYQNLAGCRTYPCSRSNLYPPANPTSYTFASEAERNATLDAMRPAAENEWKLDELLMQAKLREPDTRAHMLDHLWRWNAMGGDLMVVELPVPTRCGDGPGNTVMPPRECTPGSGITTAASPQSSPVYQALRAFQAGERGPLPLAQNWSSAEASGCDPACKYGTCVKSACVCWAGFSGADCSSKAAARRPNACNSLVGINLEGVRDWSRTWSFVDVMKSGRGWLSQRLDGSGGWGNFTVGLTPEGWVSQLELNQKAGTMMIRDLMGHIPAGVYTVLYDGEGVIDGSMDIDVIRQVEAGRVEVALKPSTGGNNGLFLTVERTNPANPVRNIRVLMPQYGDAAAAAAMPFHPRFLDYLKNFGVIRFMAWMETNTAQLPATWAQRPRTTDRSYAGVNLGGVPPEHMVLLANMVGAAPWFSMPHTADDAYHRSFASLVKAQLRPDVKVYVEWSNECWHTGFPCGQFAQQQGILLGYNEQGAQWYGGATNEARLCYYSERTKRMSAVWKDVFADQPDRVVVVAQGQTVWPLTSDKVLSCRNATSSIDALAIAPYFGTFNQTRDTSLEAFMNTTLPAQVDEVIRMYVAQHAAIARKYNKPLISYEAGQGLGGTGIPVDANRHPLMQAVYTKYLNALAAAGVQLITHFQSIGAFGTYGSWGLAEWMDQDPATAPKLRAVQDFIAANASTCTGGGDGDGDGGGSGPAAPPEDACSGHGVMLNGACSCNTGFSGPACNVTSYTVVSRCGYQCTFKQGVCADSLVEGTTQYQDCTCSPGFWGVSCSLFGCPKNCSFNGVCLDSNLCACYPGFAGTACETDCGCNGHGMCGADNKCLCDAGWRLGPGGCEPECLGCEASGTTCAAPGECGCNPGCVGGTCFNGRCECWAGYTGKACDVLSDVRPNRGSPMGIEVGSPSYWSTQWIWPDVMKQSSSWWTQDAPDTSPSPSAWDTQVALSLGPDGYPTSLPNNTLAHKLTVRNVLLKAMPGRYVALYDGEGTIDFAFDSKTASVGKGRVEFDFVPTANFECAATGAAYCGDNGISLRLTSTNPANPLRNLRLLPPGFEGVASRVTFHPWFLQSLKRFKVLRFMSWLNTNSDVLPPWAERTRPTHDTQARPGGVALEYVAALCNELGADAWINVHHLADDSYVRSMATFLRDNLRPDVKIWVEHSNEVWSSGSAPGKYARKRGLALGLSDKEDLAGYRYHAKRSSEIFDIFTEVFGAEARPVRLRFIVATWSFVCSGSWGVGCGVTAINTTLSYGDVAAKADAVAIPGYFGCGLGANPAQDAQMSVDAMVAQCLSDEQVNATRSNTLLFKQLAAAFGLPLTTYESGLSIVEPAVLSGGSPTPGAADKYIALQRDQRFESVYAKYLAMFESIGLVSEAAPFMHFSSGGLPSKYGSWGLTEFTGQAPASAPKYRAIRAVLNDKQPAGLLPGCFGPAQGKWGLRDGQFAGVPAVGSPRKGATWVAGVAYNVTFPAGHAPANPVVISLFAGGDCGNAAPLAVSEPATARVVGFDAIVPFTVPGGALGTDMVLRIEDTVTGQRNYSEVFSVQPLQVNGLSGCVINPLLPPSQPAAAPPNHCSPEYRWNVTKLPTGICEVQPNGIRYYRTSAKVGEWTSVFKPVYDSVAQFSGNPSAAALAAAGVAVGPQRPGSPC